MPKRRKIGLTPSYRRSPSDPDRAIAVWKDKAGKPHRKKLPGGFNSPESRVAIEKLKADLKAAATGVLLRKAPLTVAGVLDAYLKFAASYYRGPDGKPTSMLTILRIVGKSLCELYAGKPAVEFGPLCLKAARQHWVDKKLARTECNRRVGIVKRIFKWAASEELIPATVFHALVTVSGLLHGRTTAPETDPVGPVDDAVVDATLSHLNRYVAGMVELQRLTGMRPGEVLIIRRCHIDTGGPVWLYTPPHHKTAHRGKSRLISIGSRAQEVLKMFFTPNLDDYLFSPAVAMAEVRAGRTQVRKTPLYPSHKRRNKKKRKRSPKRVPKAFYDRASYTRAIARACDEAFPPPAPLARQPAETLARWKARLTPEQKAELKAWRDAHRWHPNQLRHTFATRVRKQFGLEAAQVLLGHTSADVTQIYAERDQTLASTIAAKIG